MNPITWFSRRGRLPGALLAFCVLFSVSFAQAQIGSITGTVTDASTKAPLVGATVWIPDLKLGGVTNGKGEFEIRNVPAGKHKVQAKILSYYVSNQTVTVEAGKATTFNFALASNPLQQQEVVVTGLTGEVDRRMLGNEISTVPAEVITRVASPTAIDALAGSTPGIQVTRSSGTPGAGTYVTLRGRKTIYGSSEPLYVIDGILIDNSQNLDGDNFSNGNVSMANRITDINPQDIANVEILKGASAAAIYGSQASNGVIIITTKRGTMGTSDKPATITYSSSVEQNANSGSIPLQTTYGQSTPYAPYKPGSSTSWGAALPAGTTTYEQDKVPFRNAYSNEQSLTISGGNQQFNYLATGTYSDIEGTALLGSSLVRKNIRLNLNANILPHVDLTSNSNYVASTSDYPQDGSNRSGILLGALRTTPSFDNATYLEPDGVTQRRYAGYDNPIWTQHNNKFQSDLNRFLHSTSLKWTPLDWLTAEGRVGLDRYTQTNYIRLAVGSGASPSRLGKIDHYVYTSSNVNTDLTLTARHRFSDDFVGTLELGNQNLWSQGTTDLTSSETTLPFYDQINAGASKSGLSSRGEVRKVGLFAQATASFMERYNLTAAIRRDGSSTFGAGNEFHYYPKLSGAYILSDENFFKDVKSMLNLNSFKLRASYGQAGSPSLPGAYATNFLYTTAGFFDPWGRATSSSRNGQIGIRQGGGTTPNEYIVAGNTDIQPELTSEIEFGFDVSAWDNRVTFSATKYHDDITNLILAVPVAGSTGYDQQLRNAGEMYNAGIELALSVVPVNTENFAWTTTLNFARNYNIVTKLQIKPVGAPKTDVEYVSLNGGFTGMTNVAIEGQPLGVFYGYGWLRDANGKIVYSTGLADDDYGNDYKNTPKQNPHLVLLGNPNPDYTMSWVNSFTIAKDWSVSFMFDMVQGNKVWNGTKGALYNFGTAGDTKDRNDPWFNFDGQPVIDNSTNKQVTRQDYYQLYGNGFNINEPFVEDGSFIKLREASVSYRWNGLKEWSIQTVTFTLTGRNLFTQTKYTGFDPEVNTFALAEGRGFDYFTLPQVRTIRFSLSVNY